MGSTPFIGDIMLFAGNYAPKGWAFCNGQTFAIAQNQALFALLGTTYGGNGQTTFNLPNMQARIPVGTGSGSGLTPRVNGQVFGEQGHTLTLMETPAHTHTLNAESREGDSDSPLNSVPAKSGAGDWRYAQTAGGSMSPVAVAQGGGSQAHSNEMPYVCINYCIALVGIFPSAN